MWLGMSTIRCQATVPGEPVAQGRPRFTGGRFPRAYDPEKSRVYKELVSFCAKRAAPPEPADGEVHLTVDIFCKIPKRFTNRQKSDALLGVLNPTTRPDADNFAKGITDALNGLWYRDDAQIVELTVRKHYSEEPRAEIEMLAFRRGGERDGQAGD